MIICLQRPYISSVTWLTRQWRHWPMCQLVGGDLDDLEVPWVCDHGCGVTAAGVADWADVGHTWKRASSSSVHISPSSHTHVFLMATHCKYLYWITCVQIHAIAVYLTVPQPNGFPFAQPLLLWHVSKWRTSRLATESSISLNLNGVLCF